MSKLSIELELLAFMHIHKQLTRVFKIVGTDKTEQIEDALIKTINTNIIADARELDNTPKLRYGESKGEETQ